MTDPTDQFGLVRDVAVLPGGEVAVLDALAPTIRLYDSYGRHLRDIGRFGDGPGEFRNPTDLAAKVDTLVVLDEAGRLTWFDKGGQALRTERAVIEPLCGGDHNAGYGGVLPDGSLMVRCQERLFGRVRGEYRQEVGLLRKRSPPQVDTIGWFPADTGRTDARGVAVPRPYTPGTTLLWAASPTRVFVAASDQSVIRSFRFDGSDARTFATDARARRATDEDVAAEMEEMLRFVVEDNDRRVVSEWGGGRPRATNTPAIRSLVVASTGDIWVETWDAPTEGSRWIIHGADGQAKGVALAPQGTGILAVGEDRAVVLWRDEFDTDRIRLYRLSH
ncbi:MAG: hypothetical protein HKO65_05825 [Gemmatimonadetes bacterium]|nr:hypothetical protein [Gemmatimonadota bacterium]NNM04604.1 hypothetical protein [Gemmatimonadota bacterium]